MNGTVPAPSPLVVGVAALAGLLLLLGGVAFATSSRRRIRAEEEPEAEPRLRPPGRRRPFAEDDLPGFWTAPPGTPTAAAPARPPVVERRRRRSRLLPAAAVAVLLLGGAVVALVAGTRGPAAADPSPAASASPPRPVAEAVPHDVGARLTAAGLVLARVPVGVTAGFPRVSVTTSGDRALLHLELPTANCLLSQAPARPEDGGCRPTTTEFADLGTPSLRVARDGGRLTLSGRTPTYLRPDGAPPVWTGHSYDLTVTVELPAPSGGAPLPTVGTVSIADQTAPTLPDPALTTVTYGS